MAASVSIQPCSFALDCEWARSIIDRISKGLERVAKAVRRGIDLFSNGVNKFLSWFPDFLIPQWAKNLIKKALALLGKVVQKVMQLEAKAIALMKHLLAPWQIKSAGQNILDCLAPKTHTFADALQKSQLVTARTWQSDASRDFFHAVDRQHDAGKGAAEATKKFGTGVKSLGDEAVKTTMSFIADYVTSVVGIVVAAVGLPTVVGTAPSAGAIIALVGKIISAIMVLVKTAISIAGQADSFATTAAGAVPGGSWPDDVNNA